MTHTQAEAILFTVCAEFGVTLGEARYGTRLVASKSRGMPQLSVTLARATFLYRAWSAGVGATEAARVLRVDPRTAKYWYADFRARAQASKAAA